MLYVVSGAHTEEGDIIETVNYDLRPENIELSKVDNNYTCGLDWSALPVIDETYLSECRVIDQYGFEVEGAKLSLSNDESAKTSTFSFKAELENMSTYKILIAPSIFGNQIWSDSKHTKGNANPQLIYKFVPDDLTEDCIRSVENITNCRNVYSATGLLLVRDATNKDIQTLPSGFYIINGRKIIIR